MLSDENVNYDIRMRLIHIGHLIDHIQVLSDLDFQQKAWIEDSLPGIWDTWDERMCMTLETVDVDDFLKDLIEDTYEYGLSQLQIDALRAFIYKLNDYAQKVYDRRKLEGQYYYHRESYEDIIANPRWHEVVACAQETLKAFEGYQVPPDPVEPAQV